MSGSYVTRFFFNDTASTEIYTYCHAPPLHVALPIYLVLFVVVAALAAIGVHVEPARPFHLAHMIDQILRVVSHIAALRLVAVFQPRLAPPGLGDALRLPGFVVLLAVASLGGICFGFEGVVANGRSDERRVGDECGST